MARSNQPVNHRGGTKAALATALGISRQLLAYHVRCADAPPLEDVAAWKAYLERKAKDHLQPSDVAKLRAKEKLRAERAEANIKERKDKHDAGEMISVREVREIVSAAMVALLAGLERVFCGEFPADAKGKDELAIRAAARQAIDGFKVDMERQFKALAAPTNDTTGTNR